MREDDAKPMQSGAPFVLQCWVYDGQEKASGMDRHAFSNV